MPEGIRIRHHTRRNQMLPVPLVYEPWPWNRRTCDLCHTIHPCKVLHLDLDAEGAVMVTAPLWRKIQKVPQSGGFQLANPVLHPPKQDMRPQTQKVKLEGIDIGGGLQERAEGRMVFYPGQTRAATRPWEYQPDKRTVTLDEYVDISNRLGFKTSTALNVLMAKILGFKPEAKKGRTP